MVGAVIVHNGKIIGEGYHQEYGKAHAEVNAIANVRDKRLLQEATMYVSLEPCSHHGKTPPCAKLIIDSKIPKVVIAMVDPYPAVSGNGIEMMRQAGIDVNVGVLESEAEDLNKEFITVQFKKRPYIYLKWAQTQDGFIDKQRDAGEHPQPTPISNDFTQILVHKKRAEMDAIMVGTNTAVNDNPTLTTRLWYGDNPIRIIIDRNGRIPSDYNIFGTESKTIIFTETINSKFVNEHCEFITVNFDTDLLQNIFLNLKNRKINSIMVEGGSQLLQSLIDCQLWDEAYIEVSDMEFGRGIKAPTIMGKVIDERFLRKSKQIHIKPLEL